MIARNRFGFVGFRFCLGWFWFTWTLNIVFGWGSVLVSEKVGANPRGMDRLPYGLSFGFVEGRRGSALGVSNHSEGKGVADPEGRSASEHFRRR